MLRALWKDFLAQRWPMKFVFVWGWLCIIIMVGAIFAPYFGVMIDEVITPFFNSTS